MKLVLHEISTARHKTTLISCFIIFVSQKIDNLKRRPSIDVTGTKVDIRFTVVRPLHAKIIAKSFEFSKSYNGKAMIKNG